MQQLEEPLVSAQTTQIEPATPWSFWLTVAYGMLIFVAWSVVQFIPYLIFSGFDRSPIDFTANGRAVAWAGIAGLPVALAGVILVARARKGITLSSYLGLTWPPLRQVIWWTLAMVAYFVADGLLSSLLHRPSPEVILTWYKTSVWLPALLFAVVVAAPLGEEFFYRGFLFPGLSNSRGGPVLAIVLISLVFAAQHIQYDLYGMTSIFVVALLLGVIRWRTGSLWFCVALHALMNAVSMVQVALEVSK